MKTAANNYGGMNSDMSYDSIPSQFYIDALDVRITTTDGESQGSLTNLKGHKQTVNVPNGGRILGATNIRNLIIIATLHTSGDTSRFYKIEYDTVDHTIVTGPTLIYSNSGLNFNEANPIEMIGRFESENVQRIYWTDYNEPLRSMNIFDANLATTPVGLLSTNPAIKYKQPLLSIISGGGSLFTGLYQFAYRLISFDGKETLISPPSNMIHVVSDSETVFNSARYTGNPKGINSGKALTITIDTTDYTFYEKIELIGIFHEDFKGTPAITSIESQNISSNTQIEFTYTGSENSISVMSIDDYTLKTYPFYTCKTLAQVDSSLLIGNLKTNTFSLQDSLVGAETFNVSTLRYNAAGQSMVGRNNFRKVGNPVYTADEVKFNTVYNEDAHWDSRWHTDGQYKYKANGTTLGGAGANISYEFVLEPMIIDQGSASFPGVLAPIPYTSHNLSDGVSYNNTTFDSPASPFISGLLKGYKRGETYRFGLVAYRNGEVSFVEYIGDIKFPDISESSDSVNSSGELYYPLSKNLSGTSTTGYAMGIQFTLDFTTCPTLLASIDSYQIVRLERKEEDKRRICSGSLKVFSSIAIHAPPTDGWDLRINGSDRVLHLWTGNSNDANGRFENLPSTPAGAYHAIVGDYISYLSPELSFEFNNVKELMLSSDNAMTLITGAMARTSIVNSFYDSSGSEKLGTAVSDAAAKFDACAKVNKTSANGYEYVKLLNDKNYVKFGNSILDLDSDISQSTPLINGDFYMRNFYAKAIGASDLNNPDEFGQLSKGCQSILSRMTKIQNDPITGVDLYTTGSVSSTDYFNTSFVSSSNAPGDRVICDILIPKAEIYGGYNSSALENNVFVQASPVIDVVNLTPKVFGGDIFLNTFVHQVGSTYNNRLYYDDAAAGAMQRYKNNQSYTQIYPIESSINLELNYGADLKRGVRFKFPDGQVHKRWRQESNNYDTDYGKTTSTMYAYNGVYSEQSTDINFFTKPITFVSSPNNDIRVALSNVKINNESIDSWTKFLTNNYYDVDDHGPINKLVKSGNNVLFFQDTAVGSLLVNPTSVVTDSAGNPTSLGSGVGINNHSYLTTSNGSIHQWAICTTDKGIYYFDGIARKIFVVGQGNQAISEVKGIHGFLNELRGDIFLRKENGGDNPLINAGVVVAKDNRNDEILFTFKGIDTDGGVISRTLVYDENVQQFSSFYTATPSIYISNRDVLISPSPGTSNMFLHNEGNYGNFYNVVTEAYVKLIVNDNADIQKVLRFMEFNSIVRNSNKVQTRTETITAFQIETETQSTGKVAFSADRFKHKFNKWRLKIPRDQSSTSKQGRLRGTYFIVTLYFDNSTNKELILNKLLSHYDIQMF